jgi:hypothetical protein
MLQVDDDANVTVSPQSKGEDVLFQEALVNGATGRSHEVR